MYNNDSNSLNAGAPDIRLTGNQQMASYGFDEAMAESRQAYEQGLKDGTVPFDMEFEEYLELIRDQSKAPQQNLGIMAAGPGTYTQQRKQMMAGGGIAGLKQIGKPGGLVEPGISKYGMFDFITDLIPNEIKVPIAKIIPNELKNPLGLAALIGGSTKFLPEGYGKGWLGDLLERAEDVPFIGPVAEGLGRAGEAISGIGTSIGDVYEDITDKDFNIANVLGSAVSPYFGTEGSRRVNPLYPLGIGAAVGKYVEGLPKDELPMDTTSIDPAAIATAARGTDAEGAAAGLRFLPEQVTRAAEGGRIGYAGGSDYYANLYSRYAQEMIQAGNTPMSIEDFVAMIKKQEGKAQGGRIGYNRGRVVNPGGYAGELSGSELFLNLYQAGKIDNLQQAMEDADRYDAGEQTQYEKMTGNNPLDVYQKSSDPSEVSLGSGLAEEAKQNIMSKTDEIRRAMEESGVLDDLDLKAQGGRIGAQEGGLMNLGGMEKDYRQEGGFVPIGGKEKADDVPARLSKNEFVFTADAVRAAGGGNIDEGAAVMERLMENLEAGGKVSEDSQGLEGARGMFANAQQLEKRII